MAPETRLLPRLVIAAPHGRSGKTTVALGLCAALRARGLAIQPYKKGPDYIDPSWLSEAAGRPCRSLDPFFHERPDSLLQAFVAAAKDADLSLVEGNHGLFDSFDEAGLGSTAAVARTLQAPVLLVLDAARLGRTAAAIVHGCQTFEPGTNIAGVVLNNVARARHEDRIRSAIESYCGIRVVGAIPRDDALTIPDRHLGLIPRSEGETLLAATRACMQAVEKGVDLDAVMRMARSVPPLDVPSLAAQDGLPVSGPAPRIGVLRDRAFSFYYPENLEMLERLGAELIQVNSLTDGDLPQVDALYIGGGFPEVFMQELSANSGLRTAIRAAVEAGLPVYAECGGLMYLSQRITWGERSAEMVGVLPCEIEMTAEPQGHGYVQATVDAENPFFERGTVLRGHEFHNSRVVFTARSLDTAYGLSRGNGLGQGRDGIVAGNVLASYTHLHAGGAPDWARGLVGGALRYREALGGRGTAP
jgi:cobyrinic acid a,c-diamide synthase